MLQQMRNYAQNLKWILVFVILSFLLSFVLAFQSGLGTMFGGGGASADWAAKVAGRKVTVAEFQQALQRQDEMYRQMLGANYQAGQFLNASAVLDSLIDRQILVAEADRLGLVAPPEEIARTIREITGFQGPTGQFDRTLYDQYLRNARLTAPKFEAEVAEDIRVQMMNRLLTGGVVASRAALEEAWRRENETASIELVRVPLEPHLAAVTATEEELRAHHAAHADDFDAGPARKVRIARFSREAFQESLERDEEMREYYEQNVGAIYTMTEDQRRASTILVSIPLDGGESAREQARTRAEEIAARARSGEDFAALAREVSDDPAAAETGGDLGPFYRNVQEPAIDEAVFAAAAGDVVGPIETLRGFEVLKVTKGPGTQARPYEEVKDLVARGLYAKGAQEALAAALDRFDAAIAEGKGLQAAAKAAGIEVQEDAWITADGEIPGIGKNPMISAKAFELEPGSISDPIADVGGQVVLEVLETRDASPRSFEEAREEVEAAVLAEKARALARADAEALLAAAKASGDLATAAAGRSVETLADIRRGSFVGGVGMAPELNRAVFATPAGQFGDVVSIPDGVAVFRVASRVEFDEARFEADRDDLARRLEMQEAASLRQAALDKLREQYEGRIRRNEEFLAAIQGA